MRDLIHSIFGLIYKQKSTKIVDLKCKQNLPKLTLFNVFFPKVSNINCSIFLFDRKFPMQI
jgi:hypothetical protein